MKFVRLLASSSAVLGLKWRAKAELEIVLKHIGSRLQVKRCVAGICFLEIIISELSYRQKFSPVI